MNVVLEKILQIIFGSQLDSKHSIQDFNRVYFSNKRREIKSEEDLMDYIMNFAGYYNLYIPSTASLHMNIKNYIHKKQAEGSLLQHNDLNRMYGISNARVLLTHVERGVFTASDSGAYLLPQYKPFFYQALLRDRMYKKLYIMTGVYRHDRQDKRKLRTTDDIMRCMYEHCVSNKLVINERPESADFIEYLNRLHHAGKLLNGGDIERYLGVFAGNKIACNGFGDMLLNQYWVSGAKKSIAFIRDEEPRTYLPVENLGNFISWAKSTNNKIFCLTDKNLALEAFFGGMHITGPENISEFERVRSARAPRQNDMTQVLDYCIDYASFHNVTLQEFKIYPYSLSGVIEEKQRNGDLLTAADISRVTGIDKHVPSLLNSFSKNCPGGTLRFTAYNGFSQLYLRAENLKSFVTMANQYHFITSFAKLPDVFAKMMRKTTRGTPTKQGRSSQRYIDGGLLDAVDLEFAFPGCTINMKHALREFDSLCPNTVIDGRYLPMDKVDDFKRIMRIESAKKQPVQKNDDVYSLTDRQMDAIAVALAQKNYQSERNACRELFEYLEQGIFHKQK